MKLLIKGRRIDERGNYFAKKEAAASATGFWQWLPSKTEIPRLLLWWLGTCPIMSGQLVLAPAKFPDHDDSSLNDETCVGKPGICWWKFGCSCFCWKFWNSGFWLFRAALVWALAWWEAMLCCKNTNVIKYILKSKIAWRKWKRCMNWFQPFQEIWHLSAKNHLQATLSGSNFEGACKNR